MHSAQLGDFILYKNILKYYFVYLQDMHEDFLQIACSGLQICSVYRLVI